MADLRFVALQTRYQLISLVRNRRALIRGLVYDLASGLQTALGAAGDTALKAGNVLALALWAVAGIAFAARRFCWEPLA